MSYDGHVPADQGISSGHLALSGIYTIKTSAIVEEGSLPVALEVVTHLSE
jgi:hypothetical protein